tara:strand:+ start:3944 stop:5236 length:1293 start_codon:yes stop_codon:yes gene_type:complete
MGRVILRNGKWGYRIRKSIHTPYGIYKYDLERENKKQAEEAVKDAHQKRMDKKLDELARQYDLKKEVNRYERMTLSEVTPEWYQHLIDRSITPATFGKYVRQWKGHILSHFGSTCISDLTSENISKFYTGMLRAGVTEKQVIVRHKLLNRFIEWAVKRKKGLTVNPIDEEIVDNIKRKKLKKEAKARSKRTGVEVFSENHFDIYEWILLKQRIRGEAFAVPILLAGDLGRRPGEALATMYEDFVNDTVWVQRTVKRADKGLLTGTDLESEYTARNYLGEPKSNAAFRNTPLPGFSPDLLEIKNSWEMKLNEEGLLVPVNEGLIFTKKSGKPHISDSFQRAVFAPIVKELGLKYITSMQILRQYFATYQHREMGRKGGVLQDLMGHSRFATTEKHYIKKIHYSCDPELNDDYYAQPKLSIVPDNSSYSIAQ